RQIAAFAIESGEVVGEIAGIAHRLLNERMYFAGLFGEGGVLFNDPQFEAFDHERDAGEFLAEIVVEVQADAPALLVGNLEQFMFETSSFSNGGLKFVVSGLELCGALLNACFELVVGAAQIVLSATALNELAKFAADGGHHVQQIRL